MSHMFERFSVVLELLQIVKTGFTGMVNASLAKVY